MARYTENAEGITIYFEGNDIQFKKSASDIDAALKQVKKETASLNKEFKKTGDINKYKQVIQNLAIEQTLAAKAVKAWVAEVAAMKKEHGTASKEYRKATEHLNTARNVLSNITIKLGEAKDKLDDLTSGPSAIELMQEAFDELGGRITRVSEITGTLAQAFERISRKAQEALSVAVNSAIDFESAFASVKKTVDETDATNYGQLQKDLRDLSKTVPTTVSELAELASLAGQMGVGADDVVSFTKAIVDFGNSTNITAEEAVQDIAQIYNVIGKGGDFSSLENLLSAIVDLGNNSATTEKDIVTMFRNIAAAGSRIGMTEQQMAALAATLASLGLDKGGASAISTLMTKIDMAVSTNADSLRDWADAAGMSISEFKAAWGEDAAGALASLLDNLKKTADEGGNLNQVFDDLNVKEMRRVDTLGRLINANDVYRQSMDRADKAFAEGNALSNEANKRYETTASRIQIMKNTFMDFALSVGERLLPILNALVDFGTQIANFLNSMSPAMQMLVAGITGIVAVLAPLLAGVSLITAKLGAFVPKLTGLIAPGTKLGGIVANLASGFSSIAAPVAVVIGLFTALYNTDDSVRDSINSLASALGSTLSTAFKTVQTIGEFFYALLKNMWELVKLLWGYFADTSFGQGFINAINIVIGVIKTLLGWMGKVLDIIGNIFGMLTDSMNEARQLDSTVSGTGYGRRNQFINTGMIESGGYMSDGMMATGMTFNNTFTITGVNNIDQATANRLADMMTNRINENLGRRYA